MNRFPLRISWAVAALAIVVMSQVASAQPVEGRPGSGGSGRRLSVGGFGVTSVRLAAESDEVQAALKLTDEQKKKAAEVYHQLRDDASKVLQGGRGRGDVQKLYHEASAKLDEVLDDDQQKRLMGLSIQVNGANAVAESAVAKELNITNEQKEKLADVRETNMRAIWDAFRENRGLSRDEMRAKMEELRAEGDKKLLAILTTEQREQLEALKGEPVEIDISQFRGPGGRGGFDGRGNRNRDAAENEEAASTN